MCVLTKDIDVGWPLGGSFAIDLCLSVLDVK
jgi:hypothetical protein